MHPDEFSLNNKQTRHTTTTSIKHRIDINKFVLTNQLGGTYFKPKGFHLTTPTFKPLIQSKLAYILNRTNKLFLSFISSAQWLDDSKLWRSALPTTLQTYSSAGSQQHLTNDFQQVSIGWKEFARITGSFSQVKASYKHAPIQYVWRKKIYSDYNVDTLSLEKNYNHYQVEAKTSRKLKNTRLDLSLHIDFSHADPVSILNTKRNETSSLRFNVTIKDFIKNDKLSVHIGNALSRQQWNLGLETDFPPIWNFEPSIQTRYFFKKLTGWISTEIRYLGRHNIYEETIINVLAEKKISTHFTLFAGVENLLNLNQNIRLHQEANTTTYFKSEQNVFGGRFFLKAQYKL